MMWFRPNPLAAAGIALLALVVVIPHAVRAETNQPDMDRSLYEAAIKGDLQQIRDLLSKGLSDYDGRDPLREPPLSIAAGLGKLEIVKLLLEKGANVNATDLLGQTPLMIAAKEGHLEIVKLLLAKGAAPNAKNSEGKTALDFATKAGRTEVVNLLKSRASR
jgi:ankyrin repeat protein